MKCDDEMNIYEMMRAAKTKETDLMCRRWRALERCGTMMSTEHVCYVCSVSCLCSWFGGGIGLAVVKRFYIFSSSHSHSKCRFFVSFSLPLLDRSNILIIYEANAERISHKKISAFASRRTRKITKKMKMVLWHANVLLFGIKVCRRLTMTTMVATIIKSDESKALDLPKAKTATRPRQRKRRKNDFGKGEERWMPMDWMIILFDNFRLCYL